MMTVMYQAVYQRIRYRWIAYHLYHSGTVSWPVTSVLPRPYLFSIIR